MSPPKTFQDLLHACEVLKGDKQIESPISWPAKKGQPLATSFILAMANYGKPYVNLRYIGKNIYDLDVEKIILKANFLSDAFFFIKNIKITKFRNYDNIALNLGEIAGGIQSLRARENIAYAASAIMSAAAKSVDVSIILYLILK